MIRNRYLFGVFILVAMTLAWSTVLGQETIKIDMDDYKFVPDTVYIPAGEEITLQFVNIGTVEHEFMAGRQVNSDFTGYEIDLFADVDVKKEKSKVMKKPAVPAPEKPRQPGVALTLLPAQSGSMSFTLPKDKTGEWEMGCFIPLGEMTHYHAGMKGIVMVQ